MTFLYSALNLFRISCFEIRIWRTASAAPLFAQNKSRGRGDPRLRGLSTLGGSSGGEAGRLRVGVLMSGGGKGGGEPFPGNAPDKKAPTVCHHRSLHGSFNSSPGVIGRGRVSLLHLLYTTGSGMQVNFIHFLFNAAQDRRSAFQGQADSSVMRTPARVSPTPGRPFWSRTGRRASPSPAPSPPWPAAPGPPPRGCSRRRPGCGWPCGGPSSGRG